MDSQKETNVRVLERTLDILECFTKDEKDHSLMELVEITGLSTSTVHRILRTLERREYLFRDEATKRYTLGARIAYLGSLAENNSGDGLREAAYEYLVDLRDRTNESASLYVRDGVSRICLERVESKQLLRRVIAVGERLPLANGAAGKVLLSALGEEELRELLGESFEAVRDDLEKVRKRGYWVSNGEREVGLSAISAPVFDAGGKIIAAVSISGPTARIINEELAEKVQLVVECGRKISQHMGYFA